MTLKGRYYIYGKKFITLVEVFTFRGMWAWGWSDDAWRSVPGYPTTYVNSTCMF